MMQPVPRHRAGGFTLLETVLAIVLLAVLIGAGYSGIRAAAKAMASGEVSVERTNRLRVSQEFMRHQISRILPLPFDHDDGTGENKLFEGSRNLMRFVAPMPGYLSHGGAYVQTIELKRASGNTMQLWFTNVILTGYDPRKLRQADLDPQVLIDQVKSGHFEYRGYNDQGELANWTDHWDDPSKVPVMVRFLLDMDRDALVKWPDMQIALLMDSANSQVGSRFIAIPRGNAVQRSTGATH